MDGIDRIITVSLGASAIIWSLIPGGTFYPGLKGGPNRKPVPKWFGRLWFIGVGLWFIYMGLKH